MRGRRHAGSAYQRCPADRPRLDGVTDMRKDPSESSDQGAA
ncbi:MAG: DoxX family protein, partial [Rhodococcus sp. (in: high G+C Gram-positive bacteria)]